MPLDLVAKKSADEYAQGIRKMERGLKNKKKNQLRAQMINVWQERYDKAQTGRWTYKIIPQIAPLLSSGYVPGYYTSQVITGHGGFGAYLKRFKKRQDSSCPCGEPEDTAAHRILNCPKISSKYVSIEELREAVFTETPELLENRHKKIIVENKT